MDSLRSFWGRFMLFSCLLFLGMSFSVTPQVFASEAESSEESSSESSSESSKETETGNGTDLSMYTRASDVANAFGRALSPEAAEASGEENVNERPKLVAGANAGQAGGVLGYPEIQEGGVTGWVSNTFSSTSVTYTFEQLSDLDKKTQSSGAKPLTSYALYGNYLKRLGLDYTTTSGGPNIIASVFGFLMQGAYFLSELVPKMFSFILKTIQLLNPFAWLETVAVDNYEWNFGDSGINSVFEPLQNLIASLYNALYRLGLYIALPLVVILGVFSIFAFNAPAASKVLRIAVRAVVIVGLVPLTGILFTSTLNNMIEDMDAGVAFADEVVLSTFIDFEGWVRETRLQPPSENETLTASYSGGYSRYDITDPSSEMVKEINAKALRFAPSSDSSGSLFSLALNSDRENKGKGSGLSMLQTYARQSKYSASDYEGDLKAKLSGKNDAAVSAMFNLSTDDIISAGSDADSLLANGDFLFGESEGDGFSSGDIKNLYELNIYNAGTLTHNDDNAFVSGSTDDGLSPLSMYNYLNSSFTPTGLTVYSPAKVSSAFVKVDHASVVLAGSGVMGFLNGLYALSAILTLSLLGLIYPFGLLAGLFYAIPKLLSSIGASMGGSLAGATKLLVTAIAVIVEIVGTVFLYQVFQQLFGGLMTAVDDIFTEVFPAAINVKASRFAGTIIAWVLLWVGLKSRKKFIQAIEEIVSGAINKFMGALDNRAAQGSFMGADGAAQAGAQAAAGYNNRFEQNDGDRNTSLTAGGIQGMKNRFMKGLDMANDESRQREEAGREPLTMREKLAQALGHSREMDRAAMGDRALNALGFPSHITDDVGQAHDRKMKAFARVHSKDIADGFGDVDNSDKQAMNSVDEIHDDNQAHLVNGDPAVDSDGNPISQDVVGAGNRILMTNTKDVALDEDGNMITVPHDATVDDIENAEMLITNNQEAVSDTNVNDAGTVSINEDNDVNTMNNVDTNVMANAELPESQFDADMAYMVTPDGAVTAVDDTATLVNEAGEAVDVNAGDIVRVDDNGVVVGHVDGGVDAVKTAGMTDSNRALLLDKDNKPLSENSVYSINQDNEITELSGDTLAEINAVDGINAQAGDMVVLDSDNKPVEVVSRFNENGELKAVDSQAVPLKENSVYTMNQDGSNIVALSQDKLDNLQQTTSVKAEPGQVIVTDKNGQPTEVVSQASVILGSTSGQGVVVNNTTNDVSSVVHDNGQVVANTHVTPQGEQVTNNVSANLQSARPSGQTAQQVTNNMTGTVQNTGTTQIIERFGKQFTPDGVQINQKTGQPSNNLPTLQAMRAGVGERAVVTLRDNRIDLSQKEGYTQYRDVVQNESKGLRDAKVNVQKYESLIQQAQNTNVSQEQVQMYRTELSQARESQTAFANRQKELMSSMQTVVNQAPVSIPGVAVNGQTVTMTNRGLEQRMKKLDSLSTQRAGYMNDKSMSEHARSKALAQVKQDETTIMNNLSKAGIDTAKVSTLEARQNVQAALTRHKKSVISGSAPVTSQLSDKLQASHSAIMSKADNQSVQPVNAGQTSNVNASRSSRPMNATSSSSQSSRKPKSSGPVAKG